MTSAPATTPASVESRLARRFTISESSANWLTHGLGLVLALVAAPLLVVLALRVGEPSQVAACAVYGATLIMLYAASTHYHLRQDKPGEMRRLLTDHICIYLLIAGTYTPLCLTMLRGAWGWGLFAGIWSLAVVGIVFKLVWGLRFPRFSLALYLLMGWLAAVSLSLWIQRAGPSTLVLLLGGGVMYTAGTIFYARVWIGKMRYSHAVWHSAVVAGSALHYFAVRECLLHLSNATAGN